MVLRLSFPTQVARNAAVSPRSPRPSVGRPPKGLAAKRVVQIQRSKPLNECEKFRPYWTVASRPGGNAPERSLAMRNPHVIIRKAHTVAQPPSSDIAALVQRGASPSWAAKMVQLGQTAEDINELMDLAGVPASEREALVKAYSDKNLIVSSETMVQGLTDEALARDNNGEAKIERLKGGSVHSVFRVECRAAENEKPRLLAFKVLDDIDFSTFTSSIEASSTVGFDALDPQLAMRNLASRNVCDLLGFDVVAKAEIGYFTVEPGQPPALGIAMEWAEGTPGVETDHAVMDDPVVIRELAKLQLVDQLVGQCDRHKLNYLVDHNAATGDINVIGIDNDFCFGTHPRDEIRLRPNTAFPLYIDTDMAAAVEGLTPEALSAVLKGKLLDAEIEMTLTRLDGVKAAVGRCKAEGRVISPNQWSSPEVKADMLAHPQDTYWGRDRAGGVPYLESLANEATDDGIHML